MTAGVVPMIPPEHWRSRHTCSDEIANPPHVGGELGVLAEYRLTCGK
jgi:hypothetical protein